MIWKQTIDQVKSYLQLSFKNNDQEWPLNLIYLFFESILDFICNPPFKQVVYFPKRVKVQL